MKRAPLRVGAEFSSPRTGAKLEILEVPPRTREGPLLVRRHVPPSDRRTFAHVHLDFDESYFIEQGVADARRDDLALRLSSGMNQSRFYVPRGVRHVNPHNRDATWLVFTQQLEPATEGALAFMQTLGQVLDDGLDDDGELPALATLAVFDATRARTYLSDVPVWPQRKLLIPAGARLARRRGYPVTLVR